MSETLSKGTRLGALLVLWGALLDYLSDLMLGPNSVEAGEVSTAEATEC